ncbi:MAG: hypothetical protein WAM14_16780 [Candidatus Nitrosopolaris sp.]
MKFTKLTDKEDRRTKIIEYISSHQGCNAQDIITGVENYVSRVTVFNILNSLEKGGAIRKEKDKPNSRDFKFFVDTNNPLISLPIEFKEFKKYYYPLLETVKEEYKEYLAAKPSGADFTLLGRLGLIFGEFIRIYDSRALLVWPKQIRDTETLRNLYMLLFSEVIEIRNEINKAFQFLFSDLGSLTEEGIFASIGLGLLGFVPGAMLELNDQFVNTNMKTKAKRVLKHVWAIWEKDFHSYELKAANLERKMDEQFGNVRSREEFKNIASRGKRNLKPTRI